MLSKPAVFMYLLLFGAFGTAPNYIGIYYQKVFNLLDFEVGILRAIPPMISILTVPLITYLADRYLGKKVTLLACLALGTLVFSAGHVLIPTDLQKTVLQATLGSILSFSVILQTPVGSLFDSLILQTVLKDAKSQKNYGKYRMWGSLSYGVFGWVTGAAIKYTGIYNSIFYLYALLMTAAFVAIIIFMKSNTSESNLSTARAEALIPKQSGDFNDNASHDDDDGAVHVVKQRKYRLVPFFLSLFCTGMGMAIIQFQLFLYIKNVLGGDEQVQGLSTTFSILLEIPGFYYAPYLIDRFRPSTMILMGQVLLLVRVSMYILLGLSRAPSEAILPVELLHGLIFSMIWSASVQVIQTRVAKPRQTFYQGLLVTVWAILSGAIGVVIASSIAQNIGYIWMWVFVLGMVSLGIAINLLWQALEKRDKSSRNNNNIVIVSSDQPETIMIGKAVNGHSLADNSKSIAKSTELATNSN